nr:HAMP domain-containing sensor histidine kinase [uncultured Bacillus sp.]
MKIIRSLQAKYMIIILMAISLVQIGYIFIAVFVTGIAENMDGEGTVAGGIRPDELEESWHQDAGSMEKVTEESIDSHFIRWKRDFPEASMFWVNGDGRLAVQLDVKEELPTEWTPAFTVKFMKERYEGDPFTVVAFVGKNKQEGFMVIEIPRSDMNTPISKVYDRFGSILMVGMVVIVVLFIAISFLFFRGIRKRLLHLEDAMLIRDVDGLPIQIHTKKRDEIGQLEQAFNTMVCELKDSRKREQGEEQLRHELIASLSHDLRTPLTKLRAQVFSLQKEELSSEGKRSIQMMEDSVVNIDHLIDNLMSYSLLMASKYKYEARETDVVRYMRKCIASWYSAFEKEGFKIDVDLSSFKEKNIWCVDPIWFERILDNLLQNVLRHAKSGCYIGVKTESTDKYDAFIIQDRGRGMENDSTETGAGIGLSIVDMMIKGMQLDWKIDSSESGTTIRIIKYK